CIEEVLLLSCAGGPSVRHADDGALPTVPSLLVDTVDRGSQERRAQTLRHRRRLTR
ncbi:unnamed protein product, partial [Ectocarpus sp. 12 AP-2014]